MSPSPARVRVSGAHAAFEEEADVSAHRVMNVIIAGLALFVALPLLLLIAVAIKLTSRGSVLYTQERVGLDRRTPSSDSGNRGRTRDLGGRPFTIYKFRTMRVDAEVMTAVAITIGLATGREVFRETPMAALREA